MSSGRIGQQRHRKLVKLSGTIHVFRQAKIDARRANKGDGTQGRPTVGGWTKEINLLERKGRG